MEEKQAEAKEKKKAEAEAIRKAEQKRKAEVEAEKKRLVELEKQRLEEEKKRLEVEKKKLEEEKRKLEEARLAELERKRKEEEARLKAEAEAEAKRKAEQKRIRGRATPLDEAGWHLVAHMSDSGGIFDGNGELKPNYSYGTFVSNPLPNTPDFQRVFPVAADEILFITGDFTIWAIAKYQELRTLIDTQGKDFEPNLAFKIGVNGVESNTVGNVLSQNDRQDPWISMTGGHHDAYKNQRIIWGEDDYPEKTIWSTKHSELKNNHQGINVYVRAVR